MKVFANPVDKIAFYFRQYRSLAFYSSWQPLPSRDPSMLYGLSGTGRFIG
jgi:hypothetical protein